MEQSELIQVIEQARLDRSSSLSLNCQWLTSLPSSIGLLADLTNLDLTGNDLRRLPESICNLSRLKCLTVRGNRLIALPQNIGRLTNLTHLDLQGNQITELPTSIGNLLGLKVLNINLNPLTDLSMLQPLSTRTNGTHVIFLNTDLPCGYWTKFSEWKSQWLVHEGNTEIRRILIEQIGYEKICQDLEAVNIDTWREYTLLKIDGICNTYTCDENLDVTTHNEPMILIKMTCPSTGHIHILRVPPEMTRVQSAITWVNRIYPDRIAFAT
jgi:leucine-rich repeat protein SHOC2